MIWRLLVVTVLVIVNCCNSAWAAKSAQSWSLRTDDTAMAITVEDDAPVMTDLSPVKDAHHNWLPGPVKEKLLPTLTQADKAIPANWRYSGAAFNRQDGKLVLRFVNATPAMEIDSIWQARPGHGPVEHWLTIANLSGDTVTVGQQESLALQITTRSTPPLNAWWVNRGGGNAKTEGGTFERSIDGKIDVALKSDPLDGASPVPWLALQSGNKQGIYFGWEFSGLGEIHLARNSDSKDEPLSVQVGNLPDFKTDIYPHETLWVPAAFVGAYLGDIDDGSYTLHRFIMEKLRPKLPANYPDPTLAYNLYLDAGGSHATEQSVLHSAELAKNLGFETFVPDAMWFPQSGDWRWDPTRFPHGVLPIEQYVHSHGMKLGLWLAYTHGSDSDDPAALNISKHPDWFAAPPKIDHEGHLNWDALIDLSYKPARDWAEKVSENAVSEYKLDYFKTDYSPIVTQCMQTNHRHHYGVDVSYWSTLGYYAVQETLLSKFPQLMIEGCSGAGHIKDFGDIRRVHYIAVTDTLSALPDRDAIYDSTFAFPPAVLMTYTYENYYREGKMSDKPEPFFWRSAMMSAWEIDPTQSATWTQKQRDEVVKETQIYKSWIRPILQDVRVHHILPRPDGRHWDGMFYWSPSLKRGTVYIFRPDSDEGTQHVLLKGLEPGANYEVRCEDGSTPRKKYSGAGLMQTGLTITLPGKYSSDLIYVEQKGD